MEPNPKCSICEAAISNDEIRFSCLHRVCLECQHLLLISSLQKQSLNKELLDYSPACPICDKGSIKVIFNEFIVKYANQPPKKNQIDCGRCDKFAVKYCTKCNDAFCEECWNIIHVNRYRDHVPQDARPHPIADSEVCKEKFEKFSKAIMRNLNTKIAECQREVDLRIEETIRELRRFQESCTKRFKETYDAVKNKLTMIGLSLEKCIQDSSASQNNVRPNKLKILNSLSFKEIMKDFINFNEENLINKISEKLPKEIQKILDLTKNLQINLSPFIVDFPTSSVNPVQLLKNNANGEAFEKGSFYRCYWKSNGSCSFMHNNETYIAWPGYNDSKKYPLLIYNASLKKRVAELNKDSSNYINVVSLYPSQEEMELSGEEKWVYSADWAGVIRIYDVNKDFKEICEIQTGRKYIVSAVLFGSPDFSENKNLNNKEVYAVVSYVDKDKSFQVYKINREANNDKLKFELMRDIENPVENYCVTIAHYHDYKEKKTFLLFGMTNSFIMVYDFIGNKWCSNKKFVTSSHVYSIKFFNDKDQKGTFIYTQDNNLVTLADFNTGQIIKAVNLEKVTSVVDSLFWSNNQKFILVVCQNENSLKVLSFPDLEVLKSVKLDKMPSNLLKVFIKRNNQETKEGIVLCQGKKKDSQLCLFE